MKMIKKEMLLGLLMIFFMTQLQGQAIDSDRMKKDLAVTENVLSTLLGESSNADLLVGYRKSTASGDYIKDYGVIFTVNNGFGRGIAVFPKTLHLNSSGYRYQIDGSRSGIVIGQGRTDRKDKRTEGLIESEEDEQSKEELQKEAKANFIQTSKDFLADYAHLISQLKPTDHIMIRMANGSGNGQNRGAIYIVDGLPNQILGTYAGQDTLAEIMVEAKVSDMEALRKGQISRDAFMKKVKITEVERSNEKLPDLEMISSMFHRLYQQDLSDTYYTLSNISYHSVKGVGVVFNMRVYSSYESDRVFFMPSTGDKGLNMEERNKKVQELLPKFEQSFKENLVNYGRSVKSLEANELLIFEVQLTQCKECADFPKAIKFSIKKSVLDDFNNGKISESQAIDKVSVEREK